MKPTQILMKEHRLIEQVLFCAEAMSDRAHADGSLNKANAEKVLDFITHFSDGYHHAKEEKHLFRLMEERGFSPTQGPVAVMLHEHAFGRNCVKQMKESLNGASSGEKAPLTIFVENANLFVEMLRSHIQKEDMKLYPMANNVFSEDDQFELLTAFDQVETREMAPGTYDKYVALADELAQFYGVEKADLTAVEDCDDGECESGGCGGCGGN